MKAITLTALFIAAMTMSHISSAASTHEPSVKATHMGISLNNDAEDETMGYIVGPPIGWDWWKPFRPN